jgi:predicted GIY-YIG superfamily endonuclease
MVYLLHFSKRLSHAQHYIGFTEDVTQRMTAHKSGNGARLTAVLNEKGITYEVVRVWKGNRKLERKLKNRKNARKLCPVCKIKNY